MTIRTQLKAGKIATNHNETLAVRTALKAGRPIPSNHNETLVVRTALKAGGKTDQHNETLAVRTAVNAGGRKITNHNEALQTRTGIKAGKKAMRLTVPTTVHKDDRLDLMVVRAGLRAGVRRINRREK